MHWAYGTSWGGVYALLEEAIRQPILSGVAVTGAVMATDYTLLPAMNLYKPPWQYPAKTLGKAASVAARRPSHCAQRTRYCSIGIG